MFEPEYIYAAASVPPVPAFIAATDNQNHGIVPVPAKFGNGFYAAGFFIMEVATGRQG
jgi:hypothetical protein